MVDEATDVVGLSDERDPADVKLSLNDRDPEMFFNLSLLKGSLQIIVWSLNNYFLVILLNSNHVSISLNFQQ